jgi:hypothetical protein
MSLSNHSCIDGVGSTLKSPLVYRRIWHAVIGGHRAAKPLIDSAFFVLVTGAAISIGRAEFGVEQVLASGYHSFFLLLPPTVLILTDHSKHRVPENRSVRKGRGVRGGVGACFSQ